LCLKIPIKSVIKNSLKIVLKFFSNLPLSIIGGNDNTKGVKMRFRDKKQHVKKPEPNFSENLDKFGNLILTATWNGHSLQKHVATQVQLIKAKKEMINQLARGKYAI